PCRRQTTPRTGAGPGSALDRGAEEPEPARQVLLDWQLVLQLRLELELLGVVALLLLARRYERPERAGLVAVYPVDGLVRVLALEAEHRRQQLAAEPAGLQLGGGGVHRGHDVLEILVANDDPLVAELVGLRLDLAAGLLRRGPQQPVDVLLDRRKLACGQGLVDERAGAAEPQPTGDVERDRGRGHGEEPLGRGTLQLLSAREDVSKAQPGGPSRARSRRAPRAASRAAGGPSAAPRWRP